MTDFAFLPLSVLGLPQNTRVRIFLRMKSGEGFSIETVRFEVEELLTRLTHPQWMTCYRGENEHIIIHTGEIESFYFYREEE